MLSVGIEALLECDAEQVSNTDGSRDVAMSMVYHPMDKQIR